MMNKSTQTNERPSKLEGMFHFRYSQVSRVSRGKKILDIGCGLGLGTIYIDQGNAKSVVGIDYSSDAIEEAKKTTNDKSITFLTMDATKLNFTKNSFDIVVAYEVIEHLPLNSYEKFIKETARVLDKKGVLYISTPNKLIWSPGREKPYNPYHTKEFTPSELSIILTKYFKSVKLSGIICNNNKYKKNITKIKKGLGFKIAVFLTRLKLIQELSPYIPSRIKNKITNIDTLPVLNDEDFSFSEENIDQAEYLFAICNNI